MCTGSCSFSDASQFEERCPEGDLPVLNPGNSSRMRGNIQGYGKVATVNIVNDPQRGDTALNFSRPSFAPAWIRGILLIWTRVHG